MSVHESHPIVDCDRQWRLADAGLLAWATRCPRREVFLHRRRRRERDLLSAREVAVTRSSTSPRNAAMRRRRTRRLAEASASGTSSSTASSFRSGLCANASFRSGAPILEPFVQALPVLHSCAPSAIRTPFMPSSVHPAPRVGLDLSPAAPARIPQRIRRAASSLLKNRTRLAIHSPRCTYPASRWLRTASTKIVLISAT